MNKKELFECLSGLSKTNNLRDGIDIRKEEANIIVNEIERLKEIIEDYRNKEIIDFSHKLDESWYKEDYEKLNHRINKAIEYIKTIVKNTPSSMRKDYANMLLIDYKKLLEILDKVEDKKIEKVNNYVLCDYDFKNKDDDNNLIATNIIDKAFEEYSHKINEIIDKLNEGE